MTRENSNTKQTGTPAKKSWLRKIAWVFAILLLLLLLINLALRQQGVRNWLVKKVIERTNKSIKGNIHLGNVNMQFPNQFDLNDALVTSSSGDTIIYAREINLDLFSGVRGILAGSANFKKIGIQEAFVKIERKEGGYQTSIDTIFQNIHYVYDPHASGPGKPPEPIDFSAEEVFLRDVRIVGDDKAYGNYQDIFIPSGWLKLESLDVVDNVLTFSDASFEDPIVHLKAYKGVEPVYYNTNIHPDSIRPKLMVVAHHFTVNNGYLTNLNTRGQPKVLGPEQINWNDMILTDIHIDMDSFSVREQDYFGRPNSISFVHEDGFTVNDLKSSDMFLTTTGLRAYDLELSTPESRLIMDSLVFRYNQYDDYNYFENRVSLDGVFRDTRLSIKDLRKFDQVFSTNQFFIQNQEDDFIINGRFYGRINNLRADNLIFSIGEDLQVNGSFSSRNLAVRDEEYLDFQLDQLVTSPQTMQRIIPGFNLPKQFDKLGQLVFDGRFSGFFSDFVANGKMITELGTVNLDMNFNALEGRDQAEYSGEIAIVNFDLKTWTGQDDFNRGQLYAKVDRGKGLTLESVTADVSANIEFLEFRGYTYENVSINGLMTQSLFDGSLIIEDENADLNFEGTINLQDSIPRFDFVAAVKQLDLEALNLVKNPFSLSGDLDIDVSGSSLTDVSGPAAISNLSLTGIADQPIAIDSVYLNSVVSNSGVNEFIVRSNEVDANILGKFDLARVVQSVKSHLKKNHPSFTRAIEIKNPDTLNVAQSFSYTILLKDLEEIGNTFFPDVPTIKNTSVSGYFDNWNDSLIVNIDNPILNVGNARFDNINFQLRSSLNDGFVKLFFDSLAVNNQNRLSALTLNGAVLLDTLDLQLNTLQDDNVNINFQLAKIDNLFNLKLLPQNLKILGNEWSVNDNNEIIFSNDYLNVRDLRLSSDDNRVRIYQSSPKGIEMVLTGFDASIINDLWNEPKLNFDGQYDLRIGLQDIFTGKDLNGSLFLDTLYINEDDWGAMDLVFSSKNLKSPFDFDFRLQRDDKYIDAAGIFFPKNVSTKYDNGVPTEYFDFDLDIENVPLRTIEYFIPHIFSESEGELDLYANLSGIPSNLGMRGDAQINDGSLKVNYLNTTYIFDRLDIDILPGYFDFSQNIILDEIGNTARISGGIGHRIFKDFYYDFSLVANELLAFNTQKGDNDIYYGRGIGSVYGSLRGPFKRPEMLINAASLEGTTVYVPLEDSGEVGDLDFIVFTNPSDSSGVDDEADFLRDLRGMNIEINLTLTDDAKTFLIFDERSGDVIQSTGTASLKFGITRTGEFTMNGEYVITEGEYLFTLLNIINKPFTVEPGGIIRWTGDPYGAEIDLKAKYAQLSTAPANFILEYVAGQEQLLTEAKQSTDVDLEMILKGDLLSPDIDFNISFPILDGIIRSYVDSKMRVVRQDQNELNRQVFGLIVVGGFLPSGDVSGDQVPGALSNTVSELLSNQFSLYVTQLLATAVEDISFISDIDFDFSYNLYQNSNFNPGSGSETVTSGSQVQFNLKPRFFEDRWQVDIGGNYVSADAVGDEFFAGAFAVEYVLTKDRRLKIRAYQRTDNALEGKRRKFGIGLNYQKEYDSFAEFLGGMKENVKNASNSPAGSPEN